jgi:hypothetical protein
MYLSSAFIAGCILAGGHAIAEEVSSEQLIDMSEELGRTEPTLLSTYDASLVAASCKCEKWVSKTVKYCAKRDPKTGKCLKVVTKKVTKCVKWHTCKPAAQEKE